VITGVLFDLDGVLADTEPLHFAAARATLLDLGVDVGVEEYCVHWIAEGGGWEYACRTYGLALGPEELRARKAVRFRELLRDGLRERPGARAALARLRPAFRLAVATNTVRVEADVMLARLDMAALLDVVVAREDYAEAKPAPDAYLAAAAALGLPSAACVVVEDTTRGVRAARAASIPVIAVPHELTFDNDFGGCVRRLGSLDELTAELLRAL
jgi:HAD superfamily hydrolase (TIGR01509 family)